ncbi:hypothetical protein F511_41037 [Dorcoceras hygrometricum]|uniref:Uncharacterized protein n=1 Tax=Dorcoceras hygrometricum TaxID=472368 RepID=A0A2Z7CAL7_9LAMI|nr:hypothetical protein F511_41037 [Dorcoceras hygrometricum]
MVKRLETSRHDPLGITDSACKNQLVVVSVQYDPFITYIPIRSTTIGKSRVARDPIAMHTSWRSNSDIASVTRPEQNLEGKMSSRNDAGRHAVQHAALGRMLSRDKRGSWRIQHAREQHHRVPIIAHTPATRRPPCEKEAATSCTIVREIVATRRPLLAAMRGQCAGNNVLKDPSLCSDTTVGNSGGGSGSHFPGRSGKQKLPGKRLAPTSFTRKPALQTVGGGRFSNQVHDRIQSSSNQPALES